MPKSEQRNYLKESSVSVVTLCTSFLGLWKAQNITKASWRSFKLVFAYFAPSEPEFSMFANERCLIRGRLHGFSSWLNHFRLCFWVSVQSWQYFRTENIFGWAKKKIIQGWMFVNVKSEKKIGSTAEKLETHCVLAWFTWVKMRLGWDLFVSSRLETFSLYLFEWSESLDATLSSLA